MHRLRINSFAIAAVIATACQPAAGPAAGAAAPTAASTAAQASSPSPTAKAAWRPAPAPSGAPQGSTWIAVDSFDGGVLIADVIPAARSGPAPIALYLHGDGGLRLRHLEFAKWLASEGFVAVVPCWQGFTDAEATAAGLPNELGCASGAPKRASAVDVTKDLNALADAARTLPGTAKEKVVLVGHSAGATAAVLAGSLGGKVQRIVSMSGPFGTGTGPQSIKVRWGTNAVEQADKLALPLLIVHGTKDTQALVEATRTYEKLARENGKSVDAVYVDGAPHDFPFVATYWTDELKAKVAAFLNK